DLRKVTVLSKSELMRIQDQLKNVDREQELRIQEAKRREAMHLQSKEVVKLWSNTIAGQRQKNLEAKAIRQQIEEEKRKQLDLEEHEFKEQKIKEAIEKAKTQLFYQTNRVKSLHGAYLLSHVLKEREAQIQLKQYIKDASKDVNKTLLEAAKARDDEALRREEEKSRQKKEQTLSVVEELKNIMEKELAREHERQLKKQEREEIHKLHELHLWEQKREQEQQKEDRKQLMQVNQEHLTNRQLEKVIHDQKEQMEEEQRKLYLSAKQKMTKLRRDKEKEIIEIQSKRERILEKIVATQQEQAENEELKIAQAVAEREAREAKLKLEEEEKKAAMMKSMAVHREREEKERMKEEIQLKNKEMLQSKKEADKIYEEKQQLKAQKRKEELQKLQEFNRTQMAEKHSKEQQQIQDMEKFKAMNAQIQAEEEFQFQLYAKDVINTAEKANLNVVPLYKAVREGIGGGSGAAFNGIRSSYVVQDSSGAQMPKYISGATQNIKTLNEAMNIEHAKKRLGFQW
uniref:Trichohyalin-plectin-homology domain-containing protein n=1 Tax=Periophthalmus magnuspinnatus TaxID=409849 RepID=A0A3B4B8C3_9GOBI